MNEKTKENEEELPPRKMVMGQTHSSISLDYMTLKEVKKEIDELIERFGPEAQFQKTTFQYETAEYMYLYAPRLENDEEYARRLKNEAEAKERQEKQELADYERLSKKFNK